LNGGSGALKRFGGTEGADLARFLPRGWSELARDPGAVVNGVMST
jgi:hypothetical protein